MTNNPTLGFLLHDVARLLRKRFEQRAKDLGLTRSQWQTLAYLANNEGIHQSGLAEILEIEPITLVRILDKLAERGLIERRQHPTDRRIWLLYMGMEDTVTETGSLAGKESSRPSFSSSSSRAGSLLRALSP